MGYKHGIRDRRTADPAPAREGAPETVHAPLLSHFAEVVEQCGGDPVALLDEAGIAQAALTSGPATYRQLARLLELAAASLDRPDFGMMLASRQCECGIVGPLGEVMRHARSFGDVLELAVRHSYAHSLASHTWLRRSRSGGAIVFGHDIVLEGLVSASQAIEQILLVGHLTAIRLTGGAVRARRILLRHPRLSPPETYRRYFGCEVRCDAGLNATIYWQRDVACPIISADLPAYREELAAVEHRFMQKQPPLSRSVRGALLLRLEERECNGEWVAQALGLHVRTLHRHLSREGTSFRRIRDEVRRDLARYYLRDTDLDIKAISERLGFSEQSALARRAHAWFGCSPSSLRADRQGQLSDPVKPDRRQPA